MTESFVSDKPEFVKFGKIPRLSRDMIITEKIDGTNAQILIDIGPDGNWFALAGSRNRWLTSDQDNYGFAAWVKEHEQELIEGLGPGRHFGEWWGCGIQRGYDLKEKRFSLFNVQRWYWPSRGFVHHQELFPKSQLIPPCCDTVPCLYYGPFDIEKISRILENLRLTGSIAAPGFRRPEGIVIYHVASGHLYKKTFENDEKGKGDE